MARAVFAYKNLADAGLVTVSSNLSLAPPSRLTSQFPQIVKKCRNNGENSWAVTVDLLSVQSVDLFALFGLNLSVAAISRFRASVADSSAQDGSSYDSGPETGLIDSRYGTLIRRLPSPVQARYVRIDSSETGVAYIEAGRVLVSSSVQVAVTFSLGAGRNRIDFSRHVTTESGVDYTDRRGRQQRVWDLSFDSLSRAEADGFVEEMNYLSGESDDVLLIADPDSGNLGRDSIWGQISGGQPLVTPSQNIDQNSRKFTIKERM